MVDKAVEDIKREIMLLDIDADIKNNILKALIKYSEILISFYNKAYKNKEVADYYLNQSISIFRSRLYEIITYDQSPFEYVEYIVNNLDKFNVSLLNNEPRESKIALTDLVEKIEKGNYIETFYYEALTYSSTNYNKLCLELIRLAKYMGYRGGFKDIYTDESMNVVNKSKMA